jgi:two-component system chemotaxis response regulator CheB
MTYELIVIGCSWGGLHALQVVLDHFEPDFDVPVAIVQHRRADSDDTLARLLQPHTRLVVGEVEDKEPIERGHVYVAPADYHLLVEGDTFALSTDEPVAHSRPSIDVLFQSAADALGSHVAGVLLTGANRDGASGLACIKRAGGVAIVQDPNTAECRIMPEAAVAEAKPDRIMALDDIGRFLSHLNRKSRVSTVGSVVPRGR